MKVVVGTFLWVLVTASINHVFSDELKEMETNYGKSAERNSLVRSDMSPDQHSAEIASGNGIKGQNYGFFGSFNYFFDPNHHGDHHGGGHHGDGEDHHKPNPPKPKPPSTHFPTAPPPPPRTTTPQGGIPFCPSPSSDSTYYCLGSNTCHSDNDCYLAEMCCRTMYDRPTAKAIGIPCCVSAFRPYYTQPWIAAGRIK